MCYVRNTRVIVQSLLFSVGCGVMLNVKVGWGGGSYAACFVCYVRNTRVVEPQPALFAQVRLLRVWEGLELQCPVRACMVCLCCVLCIMYA